MELAYSINFLKTFPNMMLFYIMQMPLYSGLRINDRSGGAVVVPDDGAARR